MSVRTVRVVIAPLLAIGLGLLFVELALDGAALVSPRVRYYLSPPWTRERIPDPVLGSRMSPYYPGHDRLGYRNPRVPADAPVLAVGDSFVYGYAAEPDGAWPRQLEKLIGKTVYNAGVGGYGPCEYQIVAARLITQFHPKTIIVGLFLTNDLSDAYSSVYVSKRFPQLASRDQSVLTAIHEADRGGTMIERGYRLGLRGDETPARRGGVIQFLSDHSGLYGLLRSAMAALTPAAYRPQFRERPDSRDSFEVAAARPARVAYGGGAARTVFIDPGVDLLALDRSDPRIRDGERIAHDALLALRDVAQKAGASLLVVFFPNKATVYADRLNAANMSGSGFAKLADEDISATEAFGHFLQAHDIRFVDTRDALRAALTNGEVPYPESDDPHPNAVGYAAIAHSVASEMTGAARPAPPLR